MGRGRSGALVPAVLQRHPDPGHQVGHGKRLGDVVVGAEVEGNSARLRPGAVQLIRSIAAQLRKARPSRVDVLGHTAHVGPGDGSELSQRRTDAVADVLLTALAGLPLTVKARDSASHSQWRTTPKTTRAGTAASRSSTPRHEVRTWLLEEAVEPQQRQHPSGSQQQDSRGRERDGDLLALLDEANL
jgi:hypothetical protein